jgi:hypothetical protein
MREVARILSLLLLLDVSACDFGAKGEAQAVANAVDRYRRADNPQKPAAAGELEKVACTDAEVCALKDTCLKSARPTAEALVLKHEVERGLAELESGRMDKDDPKAKALMPKLERSAQLLDEGHRALPACDDKLLAIKRKYGI